MKYRAIKLDHGNYAWPGEAVTRKCRILDVVYNPTNKEFVRTNTIVKGIYILFLSFFYLIHLYSKSHYH